MNIFLNDFYLPVTSLILIKLFNIALGLNIKNVIGKVVLIFVLSVLLHFFVKIDHTFVSLSHALNLIGLHVFIY